MSFDPPTAASGKDDSRKPSGYTERVWESRSFSWLEDAQRDFRFALRSLAKVPSFAVIAVLVIAVGIGANTAVFSVINTVLLKPLSYPDPQSLVMLMNTGPQGSFPGANVPQIQHLAPADAHFRRSRWF